MPAISEKSLGFMIDELVTTCIKHEHLSQSADPPTLAELKQRKQALTAAIEQRIGTLGSQTGPIGGLIAELTSTLIQCWNAQEDVMGKTDAQQVAKAAKDAQLLNAKRNKLIREIDGHLGEGAITVTSKTYG
jgi:hypothetical protein